MGVEDGREFARATTSLDAVAYFSYAGASLRAIRERDGVYQLRRALVSGSFFGVLGSKPVLGRALRADDDVAGAALVAVLSYRAWQQRFGGDSAVLGRMLVMHDDGRRFTIVGVMPHGLDFPRGTDFWAPLMSTAFSAESLNVTSPTLHAVGRLRAGATLADARSDLTNFFARPGALAAQRVYQGIAVPLPDLLLGKTRMALLMFAAAAALLLLLTCINVANLLLVRGLGRMREIAVRSALGAGRHRITGQLLTESAVLAVAGGALGAVLAIAAVNGFVALAPSGMPRLDEVRVSGVLVLAAFGITATAMLCFSLAPALMTARVELQDVLRSGARQIGSGRAFRAATETLVVGQVALAVVVLFAAGLITRSLINLHAVDLGLEPKRVVIAELAVRGFDPKTQLEPLLAHVASLPGVEAVSPALTVPFAPSGHGIRGRMARPDQTVEQIAENPTVLFDVIAPNYFETLGVRVITGRAFSDDDRAGTTPVVVVSESVARHLWPGADPVGQSFGFPGRSFTVVGVVPDTRYRDLRNAEPNVYFPLKQSPFPVAPLTLVVRTSASPTAVVPALRRALAEANAGVALASAMPFEALMAEQRAQPKLNAALLAVFATAALALAAVGMFGVIGTMVRQRTRELGIRMALGASRASVRGMVLGRGLSLAAGGVAAGIAIGMLANRWLADLLFGVTPADATAAVAVAVTVLAVAIVACVVPARASTRIDPAIALRAE
jgi:putative ABC transport system permease protein